MSTIDEKVVEMRFDNSQFEKNAQTSMNTIDELKSSLKFDDASKNFKDINAAASGVNFDAITSALESVHQKFSALEIMATTALVNITNKAVNAGEQLLKALTVDQVSAGFSKYEQKTSAVQTIMAATAKDFDDEAEQMAYVNEQLDKLNWYTDETSAGFMDMVNNIGKFTSNGVKLDTAVEAMQGIANWGYISGANLNEQSRAMYNLSQAMSVGSVKLIDWKSVANANMATLEFKQTAIDTAVELGTLKKVGDGVYKTLAGTEVSATKGFEDSLKDAWFSSDVLLDTLSKYGEFTSMLYEASELTGMTATELLESIDEYKAGTLDLNDLAHETGQSVEILTGMYKDLSSETNDLGMRSLIAAQEAKTFTEAIEAVKDAVSTGWMNSFQTIFGDYKEAKELWTNVSNELWDTFASGGEARNKMLKEWKELGGRDLMIEAVANAWYGVKDALGTVKKAFREIFPAMDAERLVAITEHVRDLTASFRRLFEPVHEVTEATGEFDEEGNEIMKTIKTANPVFEMLKNAFKGIFAVAKIVTMALSAIWGGVKQVLKMLTPLVGVVLKVSESFGKWLVALQQQLKTSGVFKRYIQILVDTLKTIPVLIDWISQKLTGMPLVEVFQNGAGRIKKTLTILGNFVKNFMETFVNAFRSAERWEKDAGDNLFWQIASGWIRAITKTAAYFTDTIFNALEAATGINFSGIRNKVRNVINEISKDVVKVISFLDDAFNQAFEMAKIWFDAFGGGFEGIAYGVWAFIDSVLDDVFKKLSDITGIDFFSIWTRLSGVFKNIADAIVELYTQIRWLFSNIKAFGKYWLSEGGGGITGIVSFVMHVITEIVTRSIAVIGELIGVDLSKISEFVGKVLDGIRVVVINLINFIKAALPYVIPVITWVIDTTIMVVKTLVDYLSKLPDKINEIFQKITGLSVGEAFTKLKDAASGMLEKIKEVFKGFREVDTDAAGEFSEKTEKKLSPLTTLFEGLKKFFSGILEVLKALRPIFSSIFDLIGKGLSKLGGAIGGFAKDGGVNKLVDLLKSGIVISILLKIRKMFSNGAGALGGIKDIISNTAKVVKNIGDVVGQVGKTLEAFQQQVKAKALLSIAIAIGILAVSLIALAGMDTDQVTKGVAALSAIALVLSKTFKSVTNSNISGPKALGVAAILLTMGIAILLMASAVKKMGKLDPEVLTRGLIGVAGLMIGLVLVMKALSSDSQSSKRMMKGALGLIAMAIAIRLLVKPIKQLGEMKMETLKQGLLALGALLLGVALFVKMTGGEKKMMSIGVGLILVAFALKLMIGSVKKMGEMDLNTLKQGMLALGALLLGVALFTAIVGNTKGMIKAAVALIIIVTAIGIMVAEVAALGKMETENLVKGLIAMVVILGALAAFTKLVGSNLGAALTITIIAGAMLILAAALVVLSAIPGKKLAASLLAVIAIIVILVATMYAIKTAGLSETMTKFGMALLLIGAGIALAGVGVLALSVGLSILAAGGSAAAAALALLIATLIDALAEGMPKIIRTLLSAAGQILDGIVELTPKIIAAIKAILEGLLDLLDFADQNSTGYKLVKTIFDLTKQVLNGILDMLDFDDPNTPGHKLIKAVVSLISQLLTEVENRSESWTKSIVGIISGIIKGLNAKVPELIEDVVTLVCNILDSLGKNIGKIIESTIVFLCNVLEGLAVAIEKHRQEIIDAVWSAVSAIISLILGLFGLSDEDIEMLFGFCAELVENVKKGIEQAIDDFQYVGDFFHDLIFNGGEPSDEGFNDGKDYGNGIIKGLDESQEEYEKRNSKIFELYKQRGQEFFETFNKLMGIGDYAPKKDVLNKMLELTNVHLTDALGNAIQFKNLMDEMNGKPFTNQYILDISQAKTAATELSNAMNGIDGGSITIKASNEASALLNNMNSNTLDLTSKIGKLDSAIEAFNKKELSGNVYISENSLVNTIVGSVNSKLGQLANQQGGLAGMVLGGILKGYK